MCTILLCSAGMYFYEELLRIKAKIRRLRNKLKYEEDIVEAKRMRSVGKYMDQIETLKLQY